MIRLVDLPVLLVSIFLASVAMAAETASEYDDQAPDKDYVWVDAYESAEGEVVNGFFRERSRDGLAWVDGYYDDDGETWVEPHWDPIKTKRDHVWVRGHVGPDDFWVVGHWRRDSRADFVWVNPVVVHGVWRHGHWRPQKRRAGYVWVPGHSSGEGLLRHGHWRADKRNGFRWVAGSWRYGVRVSAHWRPIKVSPNHVWVAGHWGPEGWVAGFLRPKLRAGFHWRSGHWGPRGWVVGSWLKGPRAVVKRHHTRVRHTRHMHIARAGNHRKIHRKRRR